MSQKKPGELFPIKSLCSPILFIWGINNCISPICICCIITSKCPRHAKEGTHPMWFYYSYVGILPRKSCIHDTIAIAWVRATVANDCVPTSPQVWFVFTQFHKRFVVVGIINVWGGSTKNVAALCAQVFILSFLHCINTQSPNFLGISRVKLRIRSSGQVKNGKH